ncbi:hypothetical protein LSH36_216g04043 [Paralvinella palmiformis]|uniref:4Fe-4S ferredoxin-type domain-containing protein n=1 Tax=Paralvinella palmiformis TaxID=53620 RepID=A0AAD9N616_9ANNE|nr:hypothetical protein LSH36_216g04043 [Paralvinella palmiformis]
MVANIGSAMSHYRCEVSLSARLTCGLLRRQTRIYNRENHLDNHSTISGDEPSSDIKDSSSRLTEMDDHKSNRCGQCLSSRCPVDITEQRPLRRAFGFKISRKQGIHKDKMTSRAGGEGCVLKKEDGTKSETSDVDLKTKTRDLFSCSEYADHIIRYTKSLELKFRLPDDFMIRGSVNKQSRAEVVDWLIKIQDHLDLEQQSLHLAVGLLDQYLVPYCNIPQGQLQLLGITCLFIARKYEEGFSLKINDLLSLTDQRYQYNQVLKMEIKILKVLNFQLHIPTSLPFLDRVIHVTGVNTKVALLSRYILDLTLSNEKMSQISASVKAGAAIYLANKLINQSQRTTWIISLSYTLGCRQRDIKTCAVLFAKHLLGAEKDKLQV